MAENQRSFGSRVVTGGANRLVPGSVYDERGNYLHNGGRAATATALKFLAQYLAGPLGGKLVDKGLSGWVNKGANYGIGPVQREAVGIPGYNPGAVGPVQSEQVPMQGQNPNGPIQQGSVLSAPFAPASVNMGLSPAAPGGAWNGYLQGPGSINNFGSQQFGTGGPAQVPAGLAPTSTWGQAVAAQPGSNMTFGSEAPGTAAIRGSGGGASGMNSGARSGGGNSVGDAGGARSAFWRKAYNEN